MARFLVKASEFKNVCKAVNDRKLAELKKEIIEILKKQDEKEVKKAIDYFNSQELHYTHLEKSLNGKWIEKAGYGVGTVRIWKGKKYKKIAPGKWARVFEKEGRGTNIAIGKLIARVQKIDNVEDLMAFVMQNKQRFVDENGVDLPVLDKLRAAVDAKNNGDMGSKDTSKPAEKKEELEKINKEMNERRAERQSAEYKEIVDKIPFESDSNKKIFLTGIKAMNISNDMKLDIADWFAKNKIDGRSYADYLIEKVKEGYDKYESSSKGKGISGKGALYKGNTGIPCDNKAAAYFAQFLAMAKDKGMEELKESETFEKPEKKEGYEEESEAEKHQNRSDAMKGNQNAKKYGITDEQIERYDIQEVVEDVNGYGIVKNSEGKYSYIDNGRVKDRPDDFETSIEKVKERINDTYETKKNVEAAKSFDFKNAKLGSDIEYTKRSDGKHLYFKKSPDGSKAISVTVEVSDMREPLNMTYEVSDTKSGESWQYETAYGNKEGLEWAVERPEQMEKELKKFFKRDPNKEWDKQNGDYKPQDDVYAPSESADMETKKAIAENKNIGENEVQMPYSKELAAEMESLKNCVSRDPVREFMQRVYYENGNLVATDGRRIKVVKVGNLNGIENGTYVDIDITKNGINIKKNDFEGQFPKYDKVIPDDLSQKVTLNNKVIKDKIKEMKKDGAIDKKVGRVQLEFKDGKVYLDDTEIGEAKNINLKYSDDWGPAREETNIINVNADYLVNALNGNSSTLMLGERADKAMGISTDSTTNIIMPMVGSHEKMDYSAGRSEKAAENEAKDKKKADNRKHSEQLIKDLNEEKIKESIENVAKDIDRQCETSDDDFLRSAYEKLNFNFDKILDKKRYITVHDKVNKDGLTFISAYMHSRLAKEHPEVKEKIAAELEKRGISVKKSLFDDFIVDVFAADDEEEIEDAIKADETEYNDYSAEQPELFNSTSMKVREALDRIRNQVL